MTTTAASTTGSTTGSTAGSTDLRLSRDYPLDDADVLLSTDRYLSPDALATELDRLWLRVWQPACLEDELRERGSWREYRVAGESFVVVRDRDLVLRAFRNVCPHRGLLLCEGQGRSNSLRCPYHGWAWNLDGSLSRVQDRDYFNPLDDESYRLREVGCGTWAGIVFINPNADSGPTLQEFLEPLDALLARYDLDNYIPVGINVEAPVACNWKAWQDAFIETYHLPFLHSQGLLFSNELRTRFAFYGEHSLMVTPFAEASSRANASQEQVLDAYLGQLPVTTRKLIQAGLTQGQAEGIDPDSIDAEQMLLRFAAQHPDQDTDGTTARSVIASLLRTVTEQTGFSTEGFSDDEVTDVWQYLAFPGLLLACHPGHAFVTWVVPDDTDPDRCLVRVVNLRWTRPEERDALREPLRTLAEDELNGEELTRLGRAVEQDVVNVRRQQEGLRTGRLSHLTLSRHEVRIIHLHRTIESYTGA